MSGILANGPLILIAAILSQASPAESTATGPAHQPTLRDLVGGYGCGDGYVIQELTVYPSGTFSLVVSQDAGQPTRAVGTAEVVDGYLVLRSSTEEVKGQDLSGRWQLKYAPVVWGERVYLIADQEMIAFCSIVNLGVQRPHGRHPRWVKSFFVRATTEQAKVAGLPVAPPRWKPYLLKKPVRGRIAKVTGKKEAAVDLGEQDGLHPGMVLWVEGLGDDGMVKVDSVSARSCVVEIDDVFVMRKTLIVGQRVFSMIPAEALEKDWTEIWYFLAGLRYKRK
jgi:hypothetical protein